MAWSATIPTTGTKVKAADDAYRANWAALQDAIGREHKSVTDATSGGVELPSRCGIIKIDTYANIDTLSDIEGSIAFATDYWDFYINDGTTWQRSRQIETSACAFFYQDAAPIGWTLFTSADDKILMIKSSIGGSISGSWTITGVGLDAPHTHQYNQVPNHTHSVIIYEYDATGAGTYRWIGGVNYYATDANTVYTGSDPASTDSTTETEAVADGAWRPKGNIGIFCTKD